jgi:hypothetical protein
MTRDVTRAYDAVCTPGFVGGTLVADARREH